MPNNWKTYKLGDIADITSSKRIFLADYVDEGIPFYRSKEIIEKANGIKISTNLFIDEKKYFDIKEKFGAPKNGDLLISAVGERAGIPYCVDNDGEFYFKDGNLIWFKNFKNDIHSKFLYYFIRTDIGTNLLESTMIGSAQRALTIIGLKNIKIDFPTFIEQQSIASILSTIDDKIENNLAINKTLEEMAMALYKHWFVDFGPFQDGEFVESELGLIPKGWELKKIGDVIETLGGGTPSTTKKEYWEDGEILWYSPTDLTRENSLFSFETAKKISPLGLQKSSAKMFPANSLLMSSRATVGLLTINTKEACTNQGFITMLPNEKLSVYQLYFWVKQNMELIISKCNGSTFKEISKSNFRDIDVIVAKDIENYIEQSKDIFEQIRNNTAENQTLTQLRDTLLPKLISGEVRLKEFRETITN